MRSSLEVVATIERIIIQHKHANAIIAVTATHADKTTDREVSRTEGTKKAEQLGCKLLETSGKTRKNVNELFMDLIRRVHNTKGRRPDAEGHRIVGCVDTVTAVISRECVIC